MKTTRTLAILMATFMALFATSCKKDNENKPNPTPPVVETSREIPFLFELPEGVTEAIEGITLEIKNKETGKINKIEGLKSNEEKKVEVEFGTYDISAIATLDDKVSYVGLLADQAITKESDKLTISLESQIKGGLVIKEIFYSGGTNDESGKAYQNGVDYIIINNNTSETIYADSICLAATASNTAIEKDIYRDFLPASVVTDFVFMVPGDGKTYPIKPGENFVLAMEAKNHHEFSSQCPDLSKHANVEWFEPNDLFQLTDNPDVPNMEIIFKTSRTISPLHVRGKVSYFIFRLEKSIDKLRKENTKSLPYPNPTVPPVDRVVVPTDWILDGVELGAKEDGIFKALPVSVDNSHTYCSDLRKGYTVQRKVMRTIGSRKIFQDTNDSKNDFLRDQPSSLL